MMPNAAMDQLGRFEELATVHRPRRYEDVDPPRPRPADRPARRAGQIVRRGAAILHRLERPQRRPPRHGQRSRPANQRIRRVPRAGKTSHRNASQPAAPPGVRADDEATTQTITDPDSPNYVAGRTEEEVYAALDLPCFPPEIREARQEFAWAAAGKLPKLIEVTDLVGDLHMHTTASDGKATPPRNGRRRDRARPEIHRHHRPLAARQHGQRPRPERLREQWDEIDRLNREFDDFTILKGIECDILEKGGMDLPDDVLAEADWVIASVHYGQQQPREQITDRILGALENPHVSIIAHPTGRLIGRREPYAVDLDAVFAAAARNGKLMEINANPARLDLDDVACAAAKRHGIPIVISSDAHSTSGLDVLRYGVLQARRGGLTAAGRRQHAAMGEDQAASPQQLSRLRRCPLVATLVDAEVVPDRTT